ncbi:hypothetical protein UO65_5273 [Actinokineospora spheciospongiae]|uniref:PPE domain-containing protein n=1 Tax=Actinokineospora spheciospongiae TaxID=909613 RepID=W7IRR1_9PSEU|nr:PPE domain-containing protein [Actinokineospora spheciospongiae]EWC59412.1 hypothetical protein UO65_5273 [Actinokineospora spheciospongiae]
MTEQATTTTDEAKRWRGFTHEELYRMLHDGPGAPASADPSRRWAAIAAALTEVGQDLGETLGATGGQWVGRAAGAAYDKLAPLAAWAQSSAVEAGNMRLVVENQGDHIAKARAEMPAPEDVPSQQPDPTAAPALAVVGVQTDAEPIEAAQSAGEQTAFEVMAAYELNTTTNLAAVVGFTKPATLLDSAALHHNRGEGVNGPTHSASFSGTLNTPGSDQGTTHRPVHTGGGPHGGGHVQVGGHGPSQGTGLSHAGGFQRTPFTPRAPLSPGMQVGTVPTGEVGFSTPVTSSTPGAKDRERSRSTNNVGTSTPGGPATHRAPGIGGGSGMSGMPGFGGDDFNTAGAATAAGTAAPGGMNPGAGAGAPMAGGAGGVGTGSDNRMAPRRFGTEALGSSQWFGDAAESVANGTGANPNDRQVGGRRRDLSQTEQNIVESHDIDGEDFHLPPGVIGG